MNLMIGDSNVDFALSKDLINITFKDVNVLNTDKWTGIACHGLTMYSCTNKLEKYIEETKIDFNKYSNVVFLFGTCDIIRKIKNREFPNTYSNKYVEFVEKIRQKYSIKNAYIISPWFIRDLKHESFRTNGRPYNDLKTSYKITEIMNHSLRENVSNYKNIYLISMINLFEENREKFNKKYSFDGVHFNDLGKEKFLKELHKIGL